MTAQQTRSGDLVVRVRDKRTGHVYTIADSAFDPEIHEERGTPAVDSEGRILPPKYNTPLGGVTPTAVAEPATTNPEGN